MLFTDVQPYDSDVLHLSISTKTYWWRQIFSNGGNLFVHLIVYMLQCLKATNLQIFCKDGKK